MNKIFIVMLFALNMVYFNQAMASSQIDQSVIFNEEGTADGENGDGKKDGKKDGEENPEEDCE